MKTMTRRMMTIAAVLMIVVGAGFILYPASTDLRYEFAQWRLASAAAAESSGSQALPAGTVARLEIPSLAIDAYVLEGTEQDVLDEGPGHYPETPLPGQAGNAGIAGHRTMWGHVFHDLDQLAEGDTIVTHTAEQSTTFEVTEVKIVDPSEIDVVAATQDTRLTLTTCHPIGSAAQRLVVVATERD